jgi:hypothetical protein
MLQTTVVTMKILSVEYLLCPQNINNSDFDQSPQILSTLINIIYKNK